MFKVGQRVKVKNIKYAGGEFNGYIGTISRINEFPEHPYRVIFDSSSLNNRTMNQSNNIFDEEELCAYEPTDIMEYLKHMLFERD